MIIKRAFEELTSLGGVLFYIIVVITLFTLNKQHESVQLIAGLLIIYVVTLLIRVVYFKKRPESMVHSSFLGRIDASSFPSVHSARAVLLAIFIAKLTGYNLIISISAALVALMVCYSRIYLKKHDAVDVIGGIILGILISVILA